MEKLKMTVAAVGVVILALAMGGFLHSQRGGSSELEFDMTSWLYDEEHQVYYQLGVPYGTQIATTTYQTLGIYVPAEYLNCTKNENNTYQCEINSSGIKEGYTATTAPIIFPVDTPGYLAQKAPTEYNYDAVADYVAAGYVYVLAGMRGRASLMGTVSEAEAYSGGAPAGLTDLKAAVRYIRYNSDVLPGDTQQIFSYGMSGGGAQSALLGATGDNDLYRPYLESIGAAMTDKRGRPLSDAITGAMAWCPITSLDVADAAYEWNMGQYFDTDSRDPSKFTSALSADLAVEFARLINSWHLTDETGQLLTLEESPTGIYTQGTYYDYLKHQVETSLTNFLSDTQFPYTPAPTRIQVGNTPGSGGGGRNLANGQALSRDDTSRVAAGESSEVADSTSTPTYQTIADYIAALNTDGQWVTYDDQTQTAHISSLEDFIVRYKQATKSVGAFDSPDASQGENNLFGNGQNESRHFDALEADLLALNQERYAAYADWQSDYVAAFENDLASQDEWGTGMHTRVDMYNPMYYLSPNYNGYGSSKPAHHWRIRTGINQTDTALTTEVNLALTLTQRDDIASVDFAMVWGQPHTTAERTGTSTQNFIDWVNECVKGESTAL